MLPLTDLKTATLYYQYVRFTRRHDWWRVINHVPCMKDCQWINRMISLYDITESAPENTVPKYRRNGARYGQTACVGGCIDQWSSSICTSHVKSAICKIRLENFWVFWSLLYWSLLFFTWLTPAWYAHGAFLIASFTSCLPMLLVANFFASLKPVLRTFLSFLFLYLQFF